MTNNTPVNNGMLAQRWINVVKKCRAQAADEDAAFIIETAIDDLMHMVHERTDFDARTLDDMCDRMSEEIERAERLQQANFKLASDNARLAADVERAEKELIELRDIAKTHAQEIEYYDIERDENLLALKQVQRERVAWEHSYNILNEGYNDQARVIINERVNNEQLKQRIAALESELAHVQALNSLLDADVDLYRDLYAEVRADKAYSEQASKEFTRALLLIAALDTENPHMVTIAELATAELERLS